ncbi:MAG: bile acid:sodium symporter family protein [Saprospiraceae bacterium]
MGDSVLTSIVLPLSLVIIMLGMGLSLIIDDFKRVIEYPKAALIGLTNQLIILPIIGFGLAVGFDLAPAMAVGLMIIAACPGGVTSNLITHVAKGDIALSISLTAISSLVTVFTIPLIVSFALGYFANDDGTVIELPILKTILQTMGITIIPVGIGMIIRHFKPSFAVKMERPVRIASTVIFLVVMIGIILGNKELILPALKSIGVVTILLNVLTMGIGFGAARLFKLNLAQSISITIESGVQNGTLALVVAINLLQQNDMSIPPALYSLLMFFTGGFLMWYFGRRAK